MASCTLLGRSRVTVPGLLVNPDQGRLKKAGHIKNKLKSLFGKSHRKAKENFQGEDGKKFDLTLFRKDTIKLIFDALHGIPNDEAGDFTFSLLYKFYRYYKLPGISGTNHKL